MRRTAKPTLLEAIEEGLPGLEDLSFGIYWGEAELSTTAVRKKAKLKGLRLPSDSENWTWFEDVFTPAAERLTYSRVSERGLAAFEVGVNEHSVVRFKGLDKVLYTFSDVVRHNGVMASLFDLRKRSPFLLTGPKATALCKRLTDGLQRRPDIARKLKRAKCGFVDLKHLQELLA